MLRVYANGQFTYFYVSNNFKPFGKLIFLAKAINMIVSANSKQWLMIINDSNFVCVYPRDTLRMPQEIVKHLRLSFWIKLEFGSVGFCEEGKT